MKLIVGLGNPGREYARSRHNVGFLCVDRLARLHHIPISDRRRLAALSIGQIEGQAVVLAKPRTYMNRSGEAVRYLFDRFPASPSDLLVIYDDLDLPLGNIRIRPKGSSAGHKGMESIIAAIGSQEFPRIRVGIGRPPEGKDPMDYVLGSFTKEEEALVQKGVETVTEAVSCILKEGLESAMNRYN